ncbi:hypothetical protein FHT40_004432 [Mycolicibacterium sp. BK556]|uniref:hypothetical protein n=1 Tax=unclassified Mycolicibacterium TaxID=2636767 RepID=UPI00161EA5EC|nr:MULTISPECIES: hypothetical protein [unclassified Mycolicibacterium]MBB3604754.1 hypothetical protein [Mycolicibacterium sp. BK556]MBB3634533.1 hypothetical protein [Mycolicibacterium sp. BK607]MBB3752110.1 hypothetical protein [Mycolicibacterium sp. BK634]
MAWWDEVAQLDDERSERLITCMSSAEAAEFGIGRVGTDGDESQPRRWWRRCG